MTSSISTTTALPSATTSESPTLAAAKAINLDDVSRLQPTMNIGTIGHVAHGKTSLVEALTGVRTTRSSEEMERNFTIRLGYANFKIFRCPRCPRPECYKSYGTMAQKSNSPKCTNPGCGSPTKLVRHLSFVDCPGHEYLMATMLSGVTVMDGAILLVAANETVPQPQTAEHLTAASLAGVKNIVTVQNKVDLVNMEGARQNYEKICQFIHRTPAEKSPVIPVCCSPASIQASNSSAPLNLDVLCQYLAEEFTVPPRNLSAPPLMCVIRSFDINRPGTPYQALKGGVAGGTLMTGVLNVGQDVEIRPGLVKNEDGKIKCTLLKTRVTSLLSDNTQLSFAVPGGLIGVGTTLDPLLTKQDRLVGQVVGVSGSMPPSWTVLQVKVTLLTRGSLLTSLTGLVKGETVQCNVWSNSVKGKITGLARGGTIADVQLESPVCVPPGEKISLSRFVAETRTCASKGWRLIGFGELVSGVRVQY
ncbi:eukaryotic translation initiation factor 2 gamma [Pelomyxa schiedti]|nr:eukaryotic translation initiation factor 2 gamma [Pelomyxa schiedti]